MKNFRTYPINSSTRILIDESDFRLIAEFNWHVNKSGYVVRSLDSGNVKQKLSDLLMKIKPREELDVKFLNGDKNDYRRENMIVIESKSRQEKGQNKTKPNITLPSQKDCFITSKLY